LDKKREENGRVHRKMIHLECKCVSCRYKLTTDTFASNYKLIEQGATKKRDLTTLKRLEFAGRRHQQATAFHMDPLRAKNPRQIMHVTPTRKKSLLYLVSGGKMPGAKIIKR
jgi:hypothetical protein